MENINHFFECYFNQMCDYQDLEKIINTYKKIETEKNIINLINDFYKIIKTNNYKLAATVIQEFGGRHLNLEKTKMLISYIYHKLLDQPTQETASDFTNKYRMLFCPFCGTNKKNIGWDNLINRATIIGKDMQIFICKHCKLMWPTEDIKKENALDYKKFMKSLGLCGTWKELCDVDFL